MNTAPHSVSQLLDHLARDELSSSEKFSPFHAEIPEAVMQRLHDVVAKAYTIGYEDGFGVAGSQAQYARERDDLRAERAKRRAKAESVVDDALDELNR
ncbi:hypothetical protein J1761_gp65 [Gordonia phage Kroos]|uniref:Uncharacterized protein n=1 Tax=Gordonia phage Kroos TaxID=2483671 RepID=A0A3G3MAQ0_9CAUD|nr:hypothetical protein J1761_gp65 [Gordonia phage Kroos]AYR03044.1 hypothetical protein SEA_KROOS_65 [Gordonia phage Kroos]